MKIPAALLVATFLVCISLGTLHAEIERLCMVSYLSSTGQSQEYSINVIFITGDELNKKTRTGRYNYWHYYALIWFDENEVAIIDFQWTRVVVGNKGFDLTDFRNMFQGVTQRPGTQANGKVGLGWIIRAKQNYSPFSFLDPRER
jgi:alpha-glucuronidase